MKFYLYSIAALLSLAVGFQAYGKYPDNFEKELTTIAFGSCNKQDEPQPLWRVIKRNKPDLWIWLGDNIYGDSKDEEVLKKKYKKQFDRSDYKSFRKKFPVIGTWDDHDYGWNNANKTYPLKERTQQMLLDFLEEPEDTPRRKQGGIYDAYEFGPEGKRVKIMLVDNRYHSDKPGEEAEMLGAEQWEWLEKELETSEAQINIIASGTQIIPTEHRHEKWANFPQDRKRLFSFIKEHKIPGVIFLSGDRHIHEISTLDSKKTSYRIVEATSSGLTHFWKNFKGEENKYRHNEVFSGLGFGIMTIDWKGEDTKIQIEIRNKKNKAENEIGMLLKELTPSDEEE